ncbi:fatty acid desaturase [Salinarimonas soli]|uniref:Fatty acid desaturase n=1 Tax=Salinarimonas soli TaxID=1638099 RepID=A0A5B2V6T0_9HYPH|nr:fatty acid desaturase [Salinarimonas soli]KAA2234674.1 fatty acid desaturase [Salinarimonas soli]
MTFHASTPPVAAPPGTPLDRDTLRRLTRHCLAFRDARNGRALWQVATTLPPFLVLCGLLLWGAATGQYLLLLLAIPAGGLLVRIFTIQHDCGHGSFFSSRLANNAVGVSLSILTLTPYGYWRRTHALHHSSAGDLSRRGVGDVDTLTVREYEALSRRERLVYRAYRNPLILHLIGPPIYFILLQRSPWGQALPAREAWASIMGLNLALLVFYGGLIWALGAGTVALALLPVACLTSWAGAWLFFVQHQFEHTHWDHAESWNMQASALEGSSHYVLPPLLQWFTGNIGLHHIHHLNSRIPNYRLQECLDADPVLATISRLTWRESMSCIGLALWDEDERRLVSFAEFDARPQIAK